MVKPTTCIKPSETAEEASKDNFFTLLHHNNHLNQVRERPSVRGGRGSPLTFGEGDAVSFVPQYFVIKRNVVVKNSWLHYCWKPPA